MPGPQNIRIEKSDRERVSASFTRPVSLTIKGTYANDIPGGLAAAILPGGFRPHSTSIIPVPIPGGGVSINLIGGTAHVDIHMCYDVHKGASRSIFCCSSMFRSHKNSNFDGRPYFTYLFDNAPATADALRILVLAADNAAESNQLLSLENRANYDAVVYIKRSSGSYLKFDCLPRYAAKTDETDDLIVADLVAATIYHAIQEETIRLAEVFANEELEEGKRHLNKLKHCVSEEALGAIQRM